MSTQIKTVLFDLDGVLVYSWALIEESFRQITTRFGLPTDGLQHPMMRSCTLREAYRHLTRTNEVEEFVQAHVSFQNENLNLLKPFPEVLPLVQALNGHFNIGVITNRYGNVRVILKHCGLLEFIGLIIGAEDVKHPKPNPEGIIAAMDHFHSLPHETIMIGDTPPDILAGNAAGVWTIAINTSDCLDALQAARPKVLIENLGEIPYLLGELN